MNTTPLAQIKSPDGVAVVLLIGRVSTPQQDIDNIQASYRYLKPVVEQLVPGRKEIIEYGDQGSGMSLDRDEMNAAEAKIASGVVDAVFIEDLSRAYREPSQIQQFLYRCIEKETRVVCPGDNLDTSDENWYQTALFAGVRHGMHIPDTVRRVRRTATHSFDRGGMVIRHRYGCRRLSKEQAESGKLGPKGLKLDKDPAAAPVILELRRLVLEERRGGAYLARYLHRKGIRNCNSRDGRWTSATVLALLRDPILYGVRRFRSVLHERNMLTGRHVRLKNKEPLTKMWPELALMTEAEWTEMNLVLNEICIESGPGGGRDLSKRRGVPRANAVFPFQHATCGICGSAMIDSSKRMMKCRKCLPREGRICWSRVVVSIDRLVSDVIGGVIDLVKDSPIAMETLVATVQKTISEHRRSGESQVEVHRRRADKLSTRCRKLATAIAAMDDDDDDTSDTLSESDNELVKQLKTMQNERREQLRLLKIAENDAATADATPLDAEHVLNDLPGLLTRLATSSFEVADFLRRIIPTLKVVPIQAIDSDQVHPRLEVIIDLSILTGGDPNPRPFVYDCFDAAVHYQRRNDVIHKRDQLIAEGRKASLNKIAAALGIGRMTVRRTLQLDQRMRDLGLSEPFKVLTTAPTSASRWRNETDREDLGKDEIRRTDNAA